MRFLVWLAFAVAACGAPQSTLATQCPLPAAERAWWSPSLNDWDTAMRRDLARAPERPPLMIVLGAHCVWAAGPGAEAALGSEAARAGEIEWRNGSLAVYGARHTGAYHAPNGEDYAPGPLAFTTFAENRSLFFMVVSSDIWLQAFPDEPDVVRFLRGVVVHELVHTEQPFVLQRLETTATSADGIEGSVDDEGLQHRFAPNPDYVEAMRAQKSALLAAIVAPTQSQRRRLARQAITAYRARQARFLEPTWRALDDQFLTLEGVAVWLSFQAAPPDEARTGAPADIAAYYAPRERGSWVQMHGGLMAALLDALDPTWRTRVFDEDWRTLPDLLEEAASA